jgi:hypothetical protein
LVLGGKASELKKLWGFDSMTEDAREIRGSIEMNLSGVEESDPYGLLYDDTVTSNFTLVHLDQFSSF